MSKNVEKPKPTSARALEREAQEIGLFGCNHENALMTPRGRYLASCSHSWKINRSFNHVTTIILGVSGAGKSSTINHMLRFKIADTNSEESETRETSEFRAIEPERNLAVSDLSLGIVDTPGFNDTEGIAQDACNLMSIDNFCRQSLEDCKPNVIMIAFKASENRFQGKNSGFFKSLKAFNKLGLVDTERPNVVVVMTHVCSKSFSDVHKWETELTKKADSVKNVIKQTLRVDAPVVFLENDYEDYRLKMSECGNQSKLPNGTWQPNNLFFAISDLLKTNGDALGVETFAHFFKTSKQTKDVKVHASVAAKIAAREALNSEEHKILRVLMNEGIEGSQLPEIIMKANEFVSKNGTALSEEEKTEIERIADDIVGNVGILSLRDLDGHSIESISDLMPSRPSNPFGLSVLKDIYKLDQAQTALDVFMSVGSAYNILSDEIKPANVFAFNQSSLMPSYYGIKLPRGMEMKKVSETETFMEYYKSEEDYIKKRMSQLGVNANIDVNMFQMKSRGGFCRSDSHSGRSSSVAYSFLYEKRIFRVDLRDLKSLEVSEKFKSDALSMKLPVKYDKNDPKNRASYQSFFDYWGHFVVSSAYGGGHLKFVIKFVLRKILTRKFQKLKLNFALNSETFRVAPTLITTPARTYLLRRCFQMRISSGMAEMVNTMLP